MEITIDNMNAEQLEALARDYAKRREAAKTPAEYSDANAGALFAAREAKKKRESEAAAAHAAASEAAAAERAKLRATFDEIALEARAAEGAHLYFVGELAAAVSKRLEIDQRLKAAWAAYEKLGCVAAPMPVTFSGIEASLPPRGSIVVSHSNNGIEVPLYLRARAIDVLFGGRPQNVPRGLAESVPTHHDG